MNKAQKTNRYKTVAVPLKPAIATTDDILRHLAFDNAAQANIISTVSNGNIIMANSTACKLLGYSKKELLTQSRSTIFKIKDSNFKKMLKQRTAEGKSIATVTVIKKSGKEMCCEITSAVFMDEGIEKSITSITDLSQSIQGQKNIDLENKKIVAGDIVLAKSKQKEIDITKEKIVAEDIIIAQAKSDSRLAENNEWIKYIAKASYDVMWDWDIATGELYVGESILEVFGYKVENNLMKFTDFINFIPATDKNRVQKKLAKALASAGKKWNDAFLFKRSDASIASTISRASIVRDEQGKATRLIGAIQDISKVQDLERKLGEQDSLRKEHNHIFQLAAKLSYDGIWDWNLVTNDFFLGEGFKDLFGYKSKNAMGNMADWSKHLHPDDKEAVEQGLLDVLASAANRWEHSYRFIRADGSVAEVFGRASIIRDVNGKATRMIGAVHDISKQRVLEEKLEQEIMLKEKHIAEAIEDAKDMERSEIGKELHDNINQLLGASRMYLNMAKGGGKDIEMYLSRSSEYTLTAIEEIRKLTKGLTSDIIKNFGISEAIQKIAADMMIVNPVKIYCKVDDFIENGINNKFKLNLFRIVQEHLNNILKHAKATTINIRLTQNLEFILLTITDNGVGFDIAKKQTGIGIANIKSRAMSYHGISDFNSEPGRGCILNIKFPLAEILPVKKIKL